MSRFFFNVNNIQVHTYLQSFVGDFNHAVLGVSAHILVHVLCGDLDIRPPSHQLHLFAPL